MSYIKEPLQGGEQHISGFELCFSHYWFIAFLIISVGLSFITVALTVITLPICLCAYISAYVEHKNTKKVLLNAIGTVSAPSTIAEKPKTKKVAVVDIETSGFQGQGGLIVEVAIVALDLETGNVTNEFNAIVKEKGFGKKHTKNPYGWVFKNSSLKYKDVLSANDLTEMLPKIQTILDKYPLGATAFNKRFDFGFLKSRGLKIKELPCIMLSAAPVVDLPSSRGFRDAKWPKVVEAWKYFFLNVAYKQTHRALDDARHEALILYELYKCGGFKI